MNTRFDRARPNKEGWAKSTRGETKTHWKAACGQSVVELAVVMPLLLLLVLGVIEIGYALYEDHLISKLAREGANLISRNTTFGDAEAALQQAALAPVMINQNDPNSRLILSAITKGTGVNANIPIILNRRVVGALSTSSVLGNPDPATYYNGPPYYNARRPSNDTQIRAVNPLPNGLTVADGQSIYITEFYFRHNPITPFTTFFAYALPSTLYASAYF